jgi:polyhydroxybutyrate depolymerase
VESLDAGAQSGSYDLSVPQSYRDHRPTPIILLFYGFGSDPAQFAALTRLPSWGATVGYLVVVPHTQGAESEWDLSAHGADAKFVDKEVASVEATYCVDRSAVFAAGFSAGAAFAIVYSCARESSIAALATVAVEFQLGCTRPMSILAFHGTEDPLVPYQNGAIGLSLPGVKVRGTERNMGDWARLDHCRSDPRRSRPGSQVIRQQWVGCVRNTSVVLYKIIGGGHSWPGADPKQALGLTTQQVSATSQVLSFFGRIRH